MIYRVHVGPNGALRYSFVSEGLRALYGLTPQQLFTWRREARLSVETKAAGLSEQWTLVAKKGRVKGPRDRTG